MSAIKKLAFNECLYINRKRAGITQAGFGALYGYSKTMVSFWERHGNTKRRPIPAKIFFGKWGKTDIRSLTKGEKLQIKRRRSGMDTTQNANKNGVSRYTCYKKEHRK